MNFKEQSLIDRSIRCVCYADAASVVFDAMMDDDVSPLVVSACCSILEKFCESKEE